MTTYFAKIIQSLNYDLAAMGEVDSFFIGLGGDSTAIEGVEACGDISLAGDGLDASFLPGGMVHLHLRTRPAVEDGDILETVDEGRIVGDGGTFLDDIPRTIAEHIAADGRLGGSLDESTQAIVASEL